MGFGESFRVSEACQPIHEDGLRTAASETVTDAPGYVERAACKAAHKENAMTLYHIPKAISERHLAADELARRAEEQEDKKMFLMLYDKYGSQRLVRWALNADQMVFGREQ